MIERYASALLAVALAEYGEKEEPGSGTSARVAEYLQSVGLGAQGDETAWCSAFLFFCAGKAGVERPPLSEAPSARSWLKCGEPIVEPQLGDVVVIPRGVQPTWQAHVGIFIRRIGKFIYILGGNQSDAVGVGVFSGERVLGYRRLKAVTRVEPS